jgi:hypothetical protein
MRSLLSRVLRWFTSLGRRVRPVSEGDFRYTVTFVNRTGETIPAGALVMADDQGRITVALPGHGQPPPGTRRLYRGRTDGTWEFVASAGPGEPLVDNKKEDGSDV